MVSGGPEGGGSLPRGSDSPCPLPLVASDKKLLDRPKVEHSTPDTSEDINGSAGSAYGSCVAALSVCIALRSEFVCWVTTMTDHRHHWRRGRPEI